MQFTSEQRDAIFTHDRNLIVTAGAGSGKTRVLVERFLALLDRHPDWALPSVVAITFTEKAAREMRDRVRRAIEARITRAVQDRDRPALEMWLAHQAALNMARIGTIHALCASILRANPAAARLDPAFEVLDENEAAILLDDAVETALARLVHEDRAASALLAAYGVRTVRTVLQTVAGGSQADMALAALDLSPEDLLARWQAQWSDAMVDVMAEARANAVLREALAWAPESGWPADGDDKLMINWALVHDHVPALVGDEPDAFIDAVQALAAGINRSGGKAANWGGKAGKGACSAALKVIQEWAKGFRALPRPGERDAEAAEWLLLWRDAIQLAADTYTRLKHDRAALDFDDLERRTRDLLEEHPDVATRYQRDFRHVLVDEFQDTNDAQRRIIYRLAGIGEPLADGRLFVVGDPKQSIYAFRGADVSVFGAVRAD
ncbi:MAG: UvrD-helicase domain-containing protein, partial [Chloroflexi bacterium]|nr:UvrD-helicase domain-containing protein [Chloroflexota bacterium]